LLVDNSFFLLKFAFDISLMSVKRLLHILTNKYFIATVAFLLLMLFFDQHDWFSQRASARELKKINENIDFLKAEVQRMQQELSDLDKPEKLEQYAREKYHEKRDNEDVFLIIRDTVMVTK
jgi:cell division protein FtsB